jgi:uncharacterized protein YceK
MIGVVALGGVLFAQEAMGPKPFLVYRSDQPRLPVSFEYPAGWEAEYSKGTQEAYAQVAVYAPASLEDRMRAYMAVRALPPRDAGGRYAGLTDVIASYREQLMPSLRIDAERNTTVLDLPTTVLEVSGTLLLPWKSLAAQPVPVKGQRLFFEAHGLVYELSWLATPEASPQLEAAFSHLLETLAFSG